MNIHLAPLRLIVAGAAALAAAPLSAVAGDVTSTRLSGQPFDWTNTGKWSHDLPGLNTFPNNGNEGHTYDVVFPTSFFVSLDQSIEVDSLQLWGGLDAVGNTLTVLGTLDSVLASITGGTVTAQNVLVSSTNLTLESSNATTNTLTINNNATVVLNGTASFAVNSFINFTGDGDLMSSSPSAEFNLSGGSTLITKTGGSSVTEITARINASNLNIKNESQFNSLIRFNQYAQAWNNVDITCDDFKSIDFSVPLTVNDVTIDNDGEVFFKGTTVLSGTLTATSPGSGAVKLSTLGGAGSISGGTLDCAISTPFIVEGFAGVGVSGTVTNQGKFEWHDGVIIGSGFRNEGEAVTNGSGLRLVLLGTLTNVANFSHNDPVTLGSDGIIDNQGTWFLNGNMQSQGVPDGDARRFESTGTIEVNGNSAIGVPFDASNTLNLNSKTVTTNDSTHLHDLVVSATGTGKLVLTPNITDPEAELLLSGNIEINGDSLLDTRIFQIAGGDYTLDGTIAGAPGNTGGDAVLNGSASLSGGVLAFSGGQKGGRFIQDGDATTIALSAPVINNGTFELIRGTIDAQGLTNHGTLRISSFGTLPVIRNLTSDGSVDQDTSFLMTAPGIANRGLWTASSATIDFLNDIPGSVFTNTGLFIVDQGGSQTVVDVTFDNVGTVSVNNNTIDFTHDVLQWDPINKQLTGGTWLVCGNGHINILDEIVIKKLALGSSFQLKSVRGAGIQPLTAIERLGGLLDLAGQTLLDATNNANNGDVEIEEDPAELRDGDSALGPEGDSPRFIANRITNRGRITVYNNGVVQANTAIDLLDTGTLTGHLGIVETPVVNNISGNVEPGFPFDFEGPGPVVDTTGQITIDGDYDQQSSGVLTIELAGTASGDCDQLIVTGEATLDGALVINAIDGYEPQPDDTFEILMAATVIGQFSSVSAPAAVDVTYLADRVVINFTGPVCEGDVDMSGSVDFADLLLVLASWSNPGGPADVDGSGTVDFGDLLLVLASWGPCR